MTMTNSMTRKLLVLAGTLGVSIVIAYGDNRESEQNGRGASGNADKQARILVYGGDNAFPPYEYLDEKGRPAGFNIDLARAVAREVGMDISIQLAPWDEVRSKMAKGELDLAGMFYSVSRERLLSFSVPHTLVYQAVFVRDDSPKYRSFDELKGRRISVQNGDIMHDYAMERGLGDTLTVTSTPEETLAVLAAGEVDYALGAHLQGLHWIRKNNWTHLRAPETHMLETEYCYAFAKRNTDLRNQFNEALRQVKESGEYRQIYNKWLGILDPKYSLRWINQLILIILTAASLLIAIAFGIREMIRQQVIKRTNELREANRALKESQSTADSLMQDMTLAITNLQRTQFALDQTADAIFWVDSSGQMIYVNEAACRSLGYTQAELLRLSIKDIDPDFPAERWPGHWQELKEKRLLEFETRHRTKDGRSFPVEIHASYLNSDGQELNFAIVNDITKRRQADAEREQMLADAQKCRLALLSVLDDEKRGAAEKARLSAAIEQAAEAVLVTDSDGNIQYVNPAFSAITGYTREEAVGQNPRFLKSGKQDAEFYHRMWGRLKEGEVWRGHFINKRKDGAFYEEATSISPVHDAANKIVNYVAVKRDITRELQLEAQFAQAQKMDAVGRLAGGVAHDFNNLLMGIMGYAELCREEISPDHPIQEWLDQITHIGQRSAEITRQLLAFASKQTIAPKVLNLNDAVTGMLKLLRQLISEGVTLDWLPGADLHPVKIDPAQVDQILANLCINARDAINGAGKITLETRNVALGADFCVEHVEARPGKYVLLTVSDNGCGMNAETLAKMFEPFFTTKEVGKGTGLGLATVYGIVKQNNGYLYATSELGKGAKFQIYLPEEVAEVDKTAANSEEDIPKGQGETILLVEDDPSLCRICQRFLVDFGYNVLVAELPEEALKKLGQHPGEIRLLLTDVVMPGMDGRQLANRISEIRPGIKILFMSGYPADVIAERGVLEENVSFIAKPFTRSGLARKVRDVLETHADVKQKASTKGNTL